MDRWEPVPVPQGDGRHDIGDDVRAAIVQRLIDDWSRDPDLTPEKVRQLAMWAAASVRALLHDRGANGAYDEVVEECTDEGYLAAYGVPRELEEEEEDVRVEARCPKCGCDLHDGVCPEACAPIEPDPLGTPPDVNVKKEESE